MHKTPTYWKNEKINSWYLKYLKDKAKRILNILRENDSNEHNFIQTIWLRSIASTFAMVYIHK